jgi:hypothetical protein
LTFVDRPRRASQRPFLSNPFHTTFHSITNLTVPTEDDDQRHPLPRHTVLLSH